MKEVLGLGSASKGLKGFVEISRSEGFELDMCGPKGVLSSVSEDWSTSFYSKSDVWRDEISSGVKMLGKERPYY